MPVERRRSEGCGGHPVNNAHGSRGSPSGCDLHCRMVCGRGETRGVRLQRQRVAGVVVELSVGGLAIPWAPPDK